jgi:hypothetical protein
MQANQQKGTAMKRAALTFVWLQATGYRDKAANVAMTTDFTRKLEAAPIGTRISVRVTEINQAQCL